MELVVATTNPHKLEEIRSILAVPSLVLIGARDLPGIPEVVEDGKTFESNAVKKAVATALFAKKWALADDSGLEVDALGGAPGVRSARYAGEPVSYAANNAKLLRELENDKPRTARFRCVIALSSPTGSARTVEGRCEGAIAFEPKGAGGFGYDPLFVPEGRTETFAEMNPGEKNAISHRGRALARAREEWAEIFGGEAQAWPMRKPRDRCFNLDR